MRISTEPGDIGYTQTSYKWDVSLDGKQIRDCVTADEEQGLVVVLVRDEDGQLAIEDDKIKTRVKRGMVHLTERKEKFQ